MWVEVETALNEKRHEIILSGAKISSRIDKNGLDENLFNVDTLNYLNIHATSLKSIPDGLSKLVNLQTLVLHSNKLTEVSVSISKLEKLKVLDLSGNQLKAIPEVFAELKSLTSLNLSSNELDDFPVFSNNPKLQVLDLANNCLVKFPDVCYKEMSGLTDLKLNGNKIVEIPSDISVLVSLKNFDISKNCLKSLPGELIDCGKLKEINLKENPIADRRLNKLIDQCRTKQILDYVKQHCAKTTVGEAKTSKKGKQGRNDSEILEDVGLFKLNVIRCTDESTRVIIKEEVKKGREHIIACLLPEVTFDEVLFKKFIQLQTRLHDGICEKRNAATIATHDASKIKSNLIYTALPPKQLKIKPLNRPRVVSGERLFTQLQLEAENLRKEKKRNVYSGIHKYLYLLEGKKTFPCLMTEENEVISFPPITNSEITRISPETTSILLEVTSDTNQATCKRVMDALIKETIILFDRDLTVQQVKNTDVDGNLKSVYPSKNDLVFEENVGFTVVRET